MCQWRWSEVECVGSWYRNGSPNLSDEFSVELKLPTHPRLNQAPDNGL